MIRFVVKIMLKQLAEFCQATASGWRIRIEMKFRVRLCQPQEQVIEVAEQPTGLRTDTIGVIRHGNRHTIHCLVEQIWEVEACIDGQLQRTPEPSLISISIGTSNAITLNSTIATPCHFTRSNSLTA
jgi:hypothetical protein